MATATNVQSSQDMLSWQYKTLLGELQQIELHVSSGDCPCILKDLDPAEYCLAKHTLNVATLAAETANMDNPQAKLLQRLNDEAQEKHDQVKSFVCHKGDLPELTEWARSYRKKLEPVYYACSRKAKMHQEVAVVTCPRIPELAEMRQEAVMCKRQTVDPRQLTIDKWLEDVQKAQAPTPTPTPPPRAGNPAIAQKLRAGADTLLPQIEAKIHPAIADQTPTARRARIAHGMYEEGEMLQRVQRAMRALADAHDAGTIPELLARLQTKAQVEDVVTRHRYPSLGLNIHRLKDILKPTEHIHEVHDDWQMVELAMRRSTSDYWVPLTEDEMYATERLLKESEKHGNRDPWTKVEFGHYKRLAAAGIRSEAQFEAAKKAIADLVADKPIVKPLDVLQREMEAKLIGLRIPGFFTTPPALADRMVQMAGLQPGMKVLEPSAGSGNIADAIKRGCPRCQLFLVEINPTLLDILGAKNFTVQHAGDFLQWQAGPPDPSQFDRIIMNPPFEHGQDVDHVRHALDLLKPGGRLVAIMGGHAFFADDKKSAAFRAWLQALGGTSEQLPSGTFEHQATSTGVVSRLVVIDKPGVDPEFATPSEVIDWLHNHRGGAPISSMVSLLVNPRQENSTVLYGVINKYLEDVAPAIAEYRGKVDKAPFLQLAIDQYEVAQALALGLRVRRSLLRPKETYMIPETAEMGAARGMTKAQWQEALKAQVPMDFDKPPAIAVAPTCPPVCSVAPAVAPSPAPQPVAAKKFELFPFQKEGVEWLKDKSRALLADDMGLGKTPQAIHWGALNLPALVVVPAALLWNWHREITTMWRQGDSVTVLEGKTSLPRPLAQWTILTYGMLDHYLPALKQAGFQSIIIDEAHMVKNLEAQRTKNLLELVDPLKPGEFDKPIPKRLAVTGTPILNRPIELFALLVFLGQKHREDFQEFLKRYTDHKYVGNRLVYTGGRNLYELNQSLKPIMIRRMKVDVLKNLPPKTHTTMFVPISNATEYREAEKNFLKWMRETQGDAAARNASKAQVLAKLNALRQLAAAGKVAPVCDWLKPCYQGTGKVIIFSSFSEPLDALKKCSGDAVIYDGSVDKRERQEMVDKFQKTTEPCHFLGTVGAAGVGITLTAANRVAFLDLPWTPGAKMQAEDRAYRIGQTKAVEIVNVLARGTIDERMLKLLADKEFIIAQAVDGKRQEEAKAESISGALMDDFMRHPVMAGLMQYEPEEKDRNVDIITEDDLRNLQGDMRQEVTMCQVSTVPKADAIRKAHGLSQKLIDAYDPEAAVRKVGKRWSYVCYSGVDHPSLYDTRHEAVEAATSHKKLKQDEFDHPEGYWPTVGTPVTVSGVCQKGKACSLKVKASDVEEVSTSLGRLPEAINDVIRKLERHRAAPISDLTFAIGPTTLTRYEFRHRLVEAEALKASHNPITFEPTPGYPPELQPRMRARSANRTQVQTIAANLDPDSLLSDFHSIDRGAPIVGPDLAVESGNGRVMAIQLAVSAHPDVYAKYRTEVIARAEGLGLSPEQAQTMAHPVVVRERVTDVPRRQFVEEANASTTLAPSAIEVARSDALKITPEMLNMLVVGDEQSIEDALRSTINRPFVTAFLSKLPQNEIAQISDKYGAMNQDGIRRLTMAVFVAAFPGDAGLGLAEKFFESTEPLIRNIANGIAQALGKLAKLEAKDPALALGADVAASARVFAEIKKTPGMTVDKYLAQSQMFEKQLNSFQEELLKLLDERSRSGKKVGALLRAYCDIALEAPPPQQIGLMPDVPRLTKPQALQLAVKRAEELTEGPRMFQAAAKCPDHPGWCPSLNKASAELDKAIKSLKNAGNTIAKYRGQLVRPMQVCQGQAAMFQSNPKGEKTMAKKSESRSCGKVTISGRCRDGVETCNFTLKRQCSPIKVTGLEPLREAYENLTGEDLPPLEHITGKADMGICPVCAVAALANGERS